MAGCCAVSLPVRCFASTHNLDTHVLCMCPCAPLRGCVQRQSAAPDAAALLCLCCSCWTCKRCSAAHMAATRAAWLLQACMCPAAANGFQPGVAAACYCWCSGSNGWGSTCCGIGAEAVVLSPSSGETPLLCVFSVCVLQPLTHVCVRVTMCGLSLCPFLAVSVIPNN